MRSSGGVADLEHAAAHPAVALVSGPAAGVVGAAKVAREAGFENAIAFDMGGTSTDVCLIEAGGGGAHVRARRRRLAGSPADRRPAHRRRRRRLDRLARCGRRAARRARERGRRPGPACYGRGGTRPTVTDANLLLGRLPARARRRREARPRGGGAGVRRHRSRPRRSRSSTPRCCARCESCRSSADATRGTSHSLPSAARARCTRARSRTSSRCGRCSCPTRPACSRRSASSRATSGATVCARISCRCAKRGSCRARARRICATRASRSSSPCRCSPSSRRRSIARTRREYGYADRGREIELVAVRTADVAAARRRSICRAAHRFEVEGPTLLELDGATCWIPPGWVGARDGPTLVLTRK